MLCRFNDAEEIARVLALQITARSNFTHDVKFEKQQEHVLITGGIYR